MIGVVIPTRGDRSVFLKNCIEKMALQTKKPDIVVVINDKPKSDEPDITYRYKKGLTEAFKDGCEVVFLIEDDDWYSNKYIEKMYNAWISVGKPEIFGLGETIYYHLGLKKYMLIEHPNRSSAFCTMVTNAVMDIDWPEDNQSFLDIYLWRQLKGVTRIFTNPVCLGIKHGIGVCGGKGHNNNFAYTDDDSELKYLQSVVGEDFKYYTNLIYQELEV